MVAMPKRATPRIFWGWWLVLATGFVTFWGHGYYTQGFSVLFKPIAADLGLSRAVTSMAASIGRFEAGLEAPLTGWVTDKYGPRWVILFGVFLIGVGLMLMWFVNSLWAFYLVWGGIVATGINVALSIPIDKAISNWFVRKRGVALGGRAVMQGLATIAVLPLIAWLIGNIGWRPTCVLGGAIMLLVGLPLIWFFVKQRRPEYYGLLPDGATAPAAADPDRARMISKGVEYAAHVQEYEFTFRQAIRTRSYWLFAAAWAAGNLAMMPLMVHFIPFLTDMGIDPVRASLMMATAGVAAIPTRLAGGLLADRAGKRRMRLVGMASFLLIAAGVAAYQLVQSVAMAQVFLILYYVGFTASLPLYTAIGVRYFGRKSIGKIQGSITLFMMPFGVMAPVYVGWIFDRTGSYATAFNLSIGLLLLAAALILFARPPKPPPQDSDIGKLL
jgi:sugar phosphate permease